MNDDNLVTVDVAGYMDTAGDFLPDEPGYAKARLARQFGAHRVVATFTGEQEYPRQKQKGLYWKYVVGALSGWSGFTKDEAHFALKRASLSYEKQEQIFVGSTRSLKTKDAWTDYIDSSIRFLTGLGCPVHLPEDER